MFNVRKKIIRGLTILILVSIYPIGLLIKNQKTKSNYKDREGVFKSLSYSYGEFSKEDKSSALEKMSRDPIVKQLINTYYPNDDGSTRGIIFLKDEEAQILKEVDPIIWERSLRDNTFGIKGRFYLQKNGEIKWGLKSNTQP